MSYKVKQIALILILAASLVGSAALHACGDQFREE